MCIREEGKPPLRSGFSLVELLIVFAILTVPIALSVAAATDCRTDSHPVYSWKSPKDQGR
jgi:Tfp pilus assembly protein FimT